jgi:hypothetical protein
MAALLLTVGGLMVLVGLVQSAPLTGDGKSYVDFVRNGLQHGASSWHERRLLGPLIVRALPLDPLQGFFVLTMTSLTATALLMWRATRTLVAIPLLLGTWVVAPNIREYALVDPLAWAVVAGVWLCTVQRRWLLAAALAAVGVLAKEVVVLSAVASAAAAWDSRKPHQAVLTALPAVAVAVLLTVLFPGSGTDAVAYLVKWVRDGLGSLGPPRALYDVFVSYGALWALLPFGWKSMPTYLQRAGAVYVLGAVALPFVGSPGRMEEAAFPLLITAAVLATRQWPAALTWLLALGNVLFIARVGGDARIPTALAWAGLLAALAITAWRAPRPFPRSALRRRPGQPQAAASPPP